MSVDSEVKRADQTVPIVQDGDAWLWKAALILSFISYLGVKLPIRLNYASSNEAESSAGFV